MTYQNISPSTFCTVTHVLCLRDINKSHRAHRNMWQCTILCVKKHFNKYYYFEFLFKKIQNYTRWCSAPINAWMCCTLFDANWSNIAVMLGTLTKNKTVWFTESTNFESSDYSNWSIIFRMQGYFGCNDKNWFFTLQNIDFWTSINFYGALGSYQGLYPDW